MVLFISLGSVYAASDVCESADLDNGILNSADKDISINSLEVNINSNINSNISEDCGSENNINHLNAINVKSVEDKQIVSLSSGYSVRGRSFAINLLPISKILPSRMPFFWFFIIAVIICRNYLHHNLLKLISKFSSVKDMK